MCFGSNGNFGFKLNKVFANAKCRLRLEKSTRMGSTFLMLERLKKAYTKDLIDSLVTADKLPVSIDFINSYLKILKPSYFETLLLLKLYQPF